jgi:hypothetical protein
MNFTGSKDILGYEGQYKIFPDGRVWSVRRTVHRGGRMSEVGGKLLKPTYTQAGAVVSFASPRKTMMIHLLVANAFVSGKFPGAMIGFKDRNRSNYHIPNLEWITRAESQRRASLVPKRKRVPPPTRRTSGALDVWDSIPNDPDFTRSEPLPWE